MTRLDEVAALVAALPGVSEADRRGSRTFFVSGKAFAWERGFTKADLRRFGNEKPPDGEILAVRVADLGEKEALLASGSPALFTIPHFDGYAAVLVRLEAVGDEELSTILVEAWLACTPAALAEQWLDSRG